MNGSHTEDLAQLGSAARAALDVVTDAPSLESWRQEFLGRGRGRVEAAMDRLKTLPPADKPAYGKAANALKRELIDAFEARREGIARLQQHDGLARARVDVSLPGRRKPVGRLHPTTQTLRDMIAAFGELGFQVAEGPEVEWDWYNFEKLRIPHDHPARDMWDTFWVDMVNPANAPGEPAERPMLLRTHTSPNQIRFMEQHEPPVRVIVPGRCYRYEATDATHEWMLTQVEVLAVDEGITLADLKGTLEHVFSRLFGGRRRVMLHHSYFPFVEPGVEVAVDCFKCNGAGCRTCHQSGWIEILGAGMVHPEALEGVGYDASRYTGFAAGLGVERIALLRNGIDDIREFYKNDPRFLEQF